MPAASVSTVRRHLRTGTLDPVYLLLGDDEGAKGELVRAFVEGVDEGLRAFNVDRFYGGETEVARVLDAARTMPLLAPRRIVVVLRAERVLMPKRETDLTSREEEALEQYLAKPEPRTTLVFVAAGLDERRRLVKRLLREATVVRCEGLHDEAEAVRWVTARVAQAGASIEARAARLLVARAGRDSARLRAEVERVLLYTADRGRVTAADVLEVSRATVEGDDWAVARAVERGDVATALRELARVLEAGAAPYMLLGQLAWVVRTRLPASRVPAAVEAVSRTDLDLKSSGGDPQVLLERLVVELCGAAGS